MFSIICVLYMSPKVVTITPIYTNDSLIELRLCIFYCPYCLCFLRQNSIQIKKFFFEFAVLRAILLATPFTKADHIFMCVNELLKNALCYNKNMQNKPDLNSLFDQHSKYSCI